MGTNTQQILKDALTLPCLISSLETEQDDGVDMAWAELAEKRYNELLTGSV